MAKKKNKTNKQTLHVIGNSFNLMFLCSVTHLSFKHVLPRGPVRQYSLLPARSLVLLAQCQFIITVRKQTVLVIIKHDQFCRVHCVLCLARVRIFRHIAIIPLPLGTASSDSTSFRRGLVWGKIVVNTCETD